MKFVNKLINKFVRRTCLTIFSVHKDCFLEVFLGGAKKTGVA